MKPSHKKFMGDFNVIITCNFYQVPQVQDSCVFKSKTKTPNILQTNFWHEIINVTNLKNNVTK
jgi:hypothetical protein